MTEAKQKLDYALKLLDELDATPLSQLNAKLDRIAVAVGSARRALQDRERAAA